MNRRFLTLSLLLLLPAGGRAAEPPSPPFLRIEAGMHTARIWRVSTDAAGDVALTCSDDKTARLWRLERDAGRYSATLLRVLRPPIDSGKDGMLNACALHPQGRLAAVGGHTGIEWSGAVWVYVFDPSDGHMVRRLGPLNSSVSDVAFSPSGRWLAAVLGSGQGLHVFESATGKEVAMDESYGGAAAHSVAWFGDERLATACSDGNVRLYQAASFGAQRKIRPAVMAATGAEPAHVSFSPDGASLTVCFWNAGVMPRILDARNLAARGSVSQPQGAGDFLRTGWLQPAGQPAVLVAGGTWSNSRDGFPAAILKPGGAGWEFGQSVVPLQSSWQDLRPLQGVDGTSLLWSSGEPSWGVLTAGSPADSHKIAESPVLDFGTTYTNNTLLGGTRVTADTGSVLFQDRTRKFIQTRFDVRERRLTIMNGNEPLNEFLPPALNQLPLSGWLNKTSVTLNDKPLPLKAGEISRTHSVAPDKQSLLLGTEFYLRCFSADGKERWKIAAPGTCWQVHYSADGSLAVAAYSDGTQRWYRTSDGRELLALFVHADRQRWVIWTPQGYYDCSPEGENLIGWHVNRGSQRAADFFPAAKFRDRFYRPDVIAKVPFARDVAAAVKQANAENPRKETDNSAETVIAKIQPPVVELSVGGLNGTLEISATDTETEIRYRIRRSSAEPVTRVRILINGRPLDRAAPVPKSDSEEAQLSVPLPNLDCTMAVLAENRYAASTPAILRVARKGSSATVQNLPLNERPRLFVLSVGISDYSDQSALPDLKFANKDGRDFAAAFQRQEGALYQKVEAKVLTDTDATAANVLDGLDWIRTNTTAKDVCAILIAGHGENDKEGRYFFCPHDYDRERRLRTAVSLEDIRTTMEKVPGKVLFFVDTCHAGNALGRLTAAPDINRVVNELSSEENGAVLFASSTGSQFSQEHGDWQNGAFTKAVVEGLDGAADLLQNGRITIASLETYIAERVRTLTKGAQTPTVAKPQTVPDFPISLKKPSP